MKTNYYVGFLRYEETNTYVYVNLIAKDDIRFGTSVETAISFRDTEVAQGVADYINSTPVGDKFKVLKVTNEVEEL